MATIKTTCARCHSTGCRAEGSKPCRDRAAKRAAAEYKARVDAETEAARPAKEAEYKAWRAKMDAVAKAAQDAQPRVSVEEARAFERASAEAQAKHAADYRADVARGLYREVETPVDAYAAERAADRKHEDN